MIFDFGEWKLAIQFDIGSYSRKALLWQLRQDGRRAIFSFKTGLGRVLEEGESAREDEPFTIPDGAMQAIMDGLWEHGFRPKDRRYENEASLMKNHLEDMRKLVFKDFPTERSES